MGGGENQREFTRVRVAVAAQVQAGARRLQILGTRNLSMKSVFVETPEPVPVGAECCVTILLGDGPVEIRAEGRVVHSYPDGFAILFQKLEGGESYEHLRQLVLYNAEDPSRIEMELEAHLGIRQRD